MNIPEKFLKFLKLLYFDQRIRWHSKNYRQFPVNSYILDIGCGKGNFVALDPIHIVGCDSNLMSLDIAKKRNFPMLLYCDAMKLPFRDKSVENIHCADLIEHFNGNEVVLILREIYRVLKRNGLLLISTPMPGPDFWGDPTHVRPYVPNSIMNLFTKDKGQGTNPTVSGIGQMVIVKKYWRYSPIFRLPWCLSTNSQRMQFINLLHPKSILFFLSNILSRFHILRFWQPSGYSLLLRKT